MRFLDEHRRRPDRLADHLPWAALVAPGVVLNKDGSFTCGFRFCGPDLDSAEDEELMAVRARLNHALKRLGTGWCLHMEARRRPADPYPESRFGQAAAWLVDEERRAGFETDDPVFETDFRGALTWMPPADRSRRLERWMFDGLSQLGAEWRSALDVFRRETGVILDLLADTLPSAEPLDDAALLTWLHACVSTREAPVEPPASPMFLDALLADEPLTGGIAPKLGGQALRVVSVRSLPSMTRPGLLDALSAMPFACRWTLRWIALDKADAEAELLRLRRRWFARRKGLGVLLREAVTKEETPLIDTDSVAKTEECDAALEALGGEVCAYGYVTLTATVLAPGEAEADERARALEQAFNARGLVARVEDLNAVEAWLGAVPGEACADVRRPIVSTLNLADLLPVSAVWAGPPEDPRLKAAPLLTARTAGSAPFRFALHVGDVGHAMVVGPTGSGKSVLLALLALQWLRYPGARVILFDKGRSARAATLAVGGRWRALEPGSDLSLQPLAGIDRPEERAWAQDWLIGAVRAAGLEPTPALRDELWSALSSLAEAPAEQRTLTVFAALLQDRAAVQALEPLTLKGAHGALLDGSEPVGLEAPVECFEMEDLMGTPSVLVPVLEALFRRVESSFDGRPVLMILDEAWLFLDASAFAARLRDWLKTLRKKGVAVVFATQSLDDVARSSIAPTLIESCPTQIFLPNPRALEPASADLYRRFGLNRRQLELIAWSTPKRAYYLRQPKGRRLFDLKLSGAGLALCGAGSPEDQALIDAVLAEHGPTDFARHFLAARGLRHVDAIFDAFAPQP